MRFFNAVLCVVIVTGLLTGIHVMATDVPSGFGQKACFAYGIGAPAISLGGAFVALADDVSGAYWNPASIASVKGYHLGGTYVPGGITYQATGLDATFQSINVSATPVQTGSLSGLGIGASWINSTISGSLGDSTSMLYNGNSCFLVSLGWMFELGDWSLATGTNVKYYYQKLSAGMEAGVEKGFGFDFGSLAKGSLADIPISLGLVSLDTGETILKWYQTQGEPINYVPWLIKGGAAVWFLDEKLMISGDLGYSISHLHEEPPIRTEFDRAHFGVEVAIIPEFAIRGGLIISSDGISVLSAGIGLVAWENITLDYAYMHRQGSGLPIDKHIFSAEFALP